MNKDALTSKSNLALKLSTLAAGVGALVPQADAGVVAAANTPATVVRPQVQNSPPVNTTAWDIDNDGIVDFTLKAANSLYTYYGNSYTRVYANLKNGIGVGGGQLLMLPFNVDWGPPLGIRPSPRLGRLQVGHSVHVAQKANVGEPRPWGANPDGLWNGTNQINMFTNHDGLQGNGLFGGTKTANWQTAVGGAYLTEGYFGFRFSKNDGANRWYYGWAKMVIGYGATHPNPVLRITEAYYENVVNTAIKVGDKPPPPDGIVLLVR